MKPIDILFPGRQFIMQQEKCVICSGDAKYFKDVLSKKEYSISGMCQTCQDKTFTPPSDDDPCDVCNMTDKPECCKGCQL
jgi:hypothetical protein